MAARGQIRYRQTGADYKYNTRYVYGNAVRQPEELPRRRQDAEEEDVRTSSRVMKNRRRSLDIRPAYVMFLTMVSACALLICLFYLGLQCRTSDRACNIAALRKELDKLTEENDIAYNAIIDSVDLEKIRDKAVNEFGMVYVSEGRVEEYALPAGYVLQYCDIPCGGIIAKACGTADQVE